MLFPHNQESLSRQALDITELLTRYTNAAVSAHAAAFQLSKKYYDAKHLDVEYEIGSEVFVDNRFLNSHPDGHDSVLVPKLRTKFSGPFTILAKSGLVNYTLEMPPSYKGDPTFHISQLRLKKTVPSNSLVTPSEPAAWKRYKDGSILVDIVAIVGHRKIGRRFRLAACHAPNINSSRRRNC